MLIVRATPVWIVENKELTNGRNFGAGSVSRGPTTSSHSAKETTFGVTVASKILGVLDDENLTENSFEFPQSNQLPASCPSTSAQYSTYYSGNRGRINGFMACGPQMAATKSVHSRPTSISNTQSFHSGSPKQIFLNGHHTTNGTSPLVHGRLSGSQRSSLASRSSLTSLQQNGSSGLSPQHSRGSPKRISPVGRQNGTVCNGYGPASGSDEGLVVIRIKPDSQGRFGFNVKGGSDQNHPIIVSRVALGSPADTCYPRLNEGDQVLMINGKDISQHTHDDVVRLIRSAREAHTGELLLTVRPNVYVGEDIEEPDFQYVPETPHVAECIPRSDLLHQSLLLLKDSLASGAAIHQFEHLYRKKPGLTLNFSKTPENLNKNRYRDVSPYDCTRVILQQSTNGDYINASFVNTKEERQLSQMQYIAWPDHGVPDNPQQFITFVSEVRRNRAGSVEPLLVHCSAGIGRTGVLILMETAMCLIEANEPVYPLDIVLTMRDQRAMLIQTASQYKFVCEAVLKAYNEGIVKPLAEYQQR